MKIVVCIKQVPDTTEVRIDPETNTLIRDGVPSIINPDDKAGLEAALRIKEENGAEVIVVSMGPPQADLAIREALAMGADKGILVSDRKFGGADTWATSQTLAGALRKIDFDLIIAGRQAIDGDTAQVGPQMAEHLGLPQVTYAEEIKVEGEHLIVKRHFEEGYQMIKIKTPCLITALKELNEPRYMRVGGIFDAYNSEVEIWGADDLDMDPSNMGLKGSPTKVQRSFTKGAKSAGKKFDNVTPLEGAKIIVEKLQEKFII